MRNIQAKVNNIVAKRLARAAKGMPSVKEMNAVSLLSIRQKLHNSVLSCFT